MFKMRNEQKSQIQTYIEGLIAPNTKIEQIARSHAEQLGLGAISLSEMEAEILKLFVSLKKPRKILEIGTLTGLTTLKIASRMPLDAELWTLEKSEDHGQRAQMAFDEMPQQMRERIHLVKGDARETLMGLVTHGPFDFVFIDGNKSAYLEYGKWCEQNVASGGVVIADNVFLGGKIFQLLQAEHKADKQTQVMDQFNRMLMTNGSWDSSIFPTNEGLLVAVRK